MSNTALNKYHVERSAFSALRFNNRIDDIIAKTNNP